MSKLSGYRVKIHAINYESNNVMQELVSFYKKNLKKLTYLKEYIIECSLEKQEDGVFLYLIEIKDKNELVGFFKNKIEYNKGTPMFKALNASVIFITSKLDSNIKYIADINTKIDFLRYSSTRSSKKLKKLYKSISNLVGESSLFMEGHISQLIAQEKLVVYCLGNKVFSVLERDSQLYLFSKIYYISGTSPRSIEELVESLLYLDDE